MKILPLKKDQHPLHSSLREHSLPQNKLGCLMCDMGIPKSYGRYLPCTIKETGEQVSWYVSEDTIARIEKALGHKITEITKLIVSLNGGIVND